MRFRTVVAASTLACLMFTATSARADVMLDPTAVTTNMGQAGHSNIDNIINQSGLSAPYTSGVTDFATYTASATSAIATQSNSWASATNTTTGNVDFTLGGPTTIDNFALWNDTDFFAVQDFTLLASVDSTFTMTTTLGSFTATHFGNNDAVVAQDFSFAATTASYVRMEITSNYGQVDTEFGEAAFGEILSVPEPSKLTMLAIGIASILGFRLRRRPSAS